MKIVRWIAAVLAGIVGGSLSVSLIETISSSIYPPPEGLDRSNFKEMSEWVKTLPAPAFLIVLLGWFSGCFVGTFLARRIAPGRGVLPSVFVGSFFTLASLFMLTVIPGPWWMWLAVLIGCPLFCILGTVVASPREYVISSKRVIRAPVNDIFQTLASVEDFSKAVEGIEKIEFLSDQKYGVGTRFRETRLMNGREATTELEVTELVENENVRIVSDAGGTIWDTIFEVEPTNSGDVAMTMKMDVRPHSFLAKVVTPLILGIVDKAVQSDMDAVKAYCESNAGTK